MELASRPARRYNAAFRLAAKASCDAEVVRRPLVACYRIYGLRVDGLGHLGLAGALIGGQRVVDGFGQSIESRR